MGLFGSESTPSVEVGKLTYQSSHWRPADAGDNRVAARRTSLALLLVLCGAPTGSMQAQLAPKAELCTRSTVVPIAPPATPLPSEDSSAAVTRFTFIAYGDTRGQYDGRSLQPDHKKVVDAMVDAIHDRAKGENPVRFVLQTGDAVVDGRIAAQWNVSFNPLINRLTVGAETPYFLAVGNHDVTSIPDVTSPERIAGLCNYFAANARLIPPEGSAHRLKDYPSYGFGYGNTFFLTFDAAIPDDPTQFDWVKAELERIDRRRYPNVVVFEHQPPISSGPHGGPLIESASATLRAFYLPLFRQHHVRLLLTGHDHLFEHWVERYRDSSGAHRLDQIVTGGGGAPAYAYVGEPDLREYLAENAGSRLEVEHLAKPSADARRNPLHFIVVSVNGEDIRVEVVGVDRGKGFAPYGGGRSATAVLTDPSPEPARSPTRTSQARSARTRGITSRP